MLKPAGARAAGRPGLEGLALGGFILYCLFTYLLFVFLNQGQAPELGWVGQAGGRRAWLGG